uniref:CAZy families GH116 protein n=1 Tax=uncultured Thermobaculum sp. TaxID=683411 RepID=A0A060CMF4_9CHLR|nr:CAZy families GH116 protein [uncultured Thermobaculum sp.]
MHFAPQINQQDFSVFWSTGSAWGTFSQIRTGENGEVACGIDVIYGNLDGVTVYVNGVALEGQS